MVDRAGVLDADLPGFVGCVHEKLGAPGVGPWDGKAGRKPGRSLRRAGGALPVYRFVALRLGPSLRNWHLPPSGSNVYNSLTFRHERSVRNQLRVTEYGDRVSDCRTSSRPG